MGTQSATSEVVGSIVVIIVVLVTTVAKHHTLDHAAISFRHVVDAHWRAGHEAGAIFRFRNHDTAAGFVHNLGTILVGHWAAGFRHHEAGARLVGRDGAAA